ncbi:DUF3494 domain-containing protein [Luteolibacter yonseiensis]|uniref:DUF3494 domain-containing protein n=1 Tax=Luteolibacter yonseiensis TaxID=1144680 RepID=A0A934R2G9_9BACT|nr:ice-binding family protein [Luteolibacter yonseiensis]MBK1815071.1 DUF3494 domain-containing protein [Luteolibacter yonseiensis]
MKTRARKLMIVTSIIFSSVILGDQAASAALLSVDLGSAASYAVLAGSGITIAGPANSSTIIGNIGSHATVSITGLENLNLVGTNHAGNSITQAAKADLQTAYTDAAGRSFDGAAFADGHVLTGIMTTGVYHGSGSFALNGILTLDAQGDPDAVWIFQMTSTFDVGSAGQVALLNGAQASNVFWQVGSSATLGTGARLAGTILAAQSISMNTGAVINGRALASAGAVTMGGSTITLPVPEPSAMLLSVIGICSLLATRRRS